MRWAFCPGGNHSWNDWVLNGMAIGSQSTSKNALVTGGAGLPGSHLCERLLERGHDTLCIDNDHTGRGTNVAHLLDRPGFEGQVAGE